MFLASVEYDMNFNIETSLKNVLILSKEYSIKDFYENRWVDEIKNKRNKLLELIHINNYEHPLLRNYVELIKKKYYNLELVSKYKDDNKEYVVLYTYRLNLFKRIWRNKRINN
jgi:hypothetical protein